MNKNNFKIGDKVKATYERIKYQQESINKEGVQKLEMNNVYTVTNVTYYNRIRYGRDSIVITLNNGFVLNELWLEKINK